MPYIDIVNEYSQKNHFTYDHKAIFKQVRNAMNKQGEEREAALQNVLKSAFRAESAKYEPMRQKLGSDLHNLKPSEAYRVSMELKNMASPAQFLEQFTNIIGAMAKDIDPLYNPPYMLGLDSREAKNLVSDQLNSYTCLDETVYTLKRDGWEEALRQVEIIKKDALTDEPRNYATTDDEHKAGMHHVHMRKEALKNELREKGFWWRLFNRAEVKQMRAYIKAAETALREVSFTAKAAKEAEAELAKAAALESDYQLSYESIDNNYKEHQALLDRENAQDFERQEDKGAQEIQPLENSREPIFVNVEEKASDDKVSGPVESEPAKNAPSLSSSK